MILPSGKELKITVADFATSRALYQAVLEEARLLNLDSNKEIDTNLYKDVLCLALSSKKIQSCLDECMKRVTYDGRKVDNQTFEPLEARQDYIPACYEVAKENILPFVKDLYAKLSPILEKLKVNLA
jgi:hypothetical protein